jgi:hypothetical protein
MRLLLSVVRGRGGAMAGAELILLAAHLLPHVSKVVEDQAANTGEG